MTKPAVVLPYSDGISFTWPDFLPSEFSSFQRYCHFYNDQPNNNTLLHGHALGQIAGLIYVTTARDGDIIGEEL